MPKLTKKQVNVLEKAFEAEISKALGEIPYPIIQTKSKEAKELVDLGYIEEITINSKGLRITGYKITLAGHAEYCSLCADI